MFVNDRSSFRPILARGRVDGDLAIAAVVVETTLGLEGQTWVPRQVARTPSDPPDSAEQPLWEGTSVTVSGSVAGPRLAPHLVHLELVVGAERRALVVTGDRQWVRNAGKLVASAPAAFESKPLSWALAFGGSYAIPPGKCPVRGLPHPGGLFVHPLNPGGVGLHRDAQSAEGKPLPSIEWRDAPMVRWDDRPEPAGFAPCPELRGLRLPKGALANDLDDAEAQVGLACRLVHPAPGRLIFGALVPGSSVALRGLPVGLPAVELPSSPVSVVARKGAGATVVPSGVRWVHLDVDARTVRVCFGHSFGYSPARPPTVVAVRDA